MDEHGATRPWSREALAEGGFTGFVRVGEVDVDAVPQAPGVYALVRTAEQRPVFMRESSGGRFRGKNPALEPAVLERSWIEGPEVLYVGKATASGAGRRGLQKRVDELRRFGAGEPVSHWGGRAVWQLADRDELLVAWNATDEDPAAVEARMLRDFKERYGALPFANQRR